MVADQTRWWHYTTGVAFLQIVEAKHNRRSSVMDGDGRSAVWFSCRDEWEPTATKAFLKAGAPRSEARQCTIAEMVESRMPVP
jgi:hypothetical protein